METKCLELVESLSDLDLRVQLRQAVNGCAENLLVDLFVDVWVVNRQSFIKQRATQSGDKCQGLTKLPTLGNFVTQWRGDIVQTNLCLGAEFE